jgi:hypothetical protein
MLRRLAQRVRAHHRVARLEQTLVRGATFPPPLGTRETVAMDKPASAATVRTVRTASTASTASTATRSVCSPVPVPKLETEHCFIAPP